jgi:hypothetical protein
MTSNKGEYSQSFDSEIKEYELYLNNAETSIELNLKANNRYAKITSITYNDEEKLVEAANEVIQTLEVGVTDPAGVIKVKVTAEDNSESIYQITIKDEIYVSSNANLKSLTFDKGIIDRTFNSLKATYTLFIDDSMTSIRMIAEVENPESTITSIKFNNTELVTSATGRAMKVLTVDPNVESTVEIVVTAKEGTTKKYLVKIKNQSKASSDATLKELSLDKGVISREFNKNVTSYDVYLENLNETINLKASTSDKLAMIRSIKYNNVEIQEAESNEITKELVMDGTEKQ